MQMERRRRPRAVTTVIPERGPVERLIVFLSSHGFSAFDALMIPFHVLFASIMLVTSEDAIRASPVYSRIAQAAPIWLWAALLIGMSACITTGIIFNWWLVARFSYVLVAAWWFAIGGLVYVAATTLLSPSVYALIGVVCLYRQAEIAVGAEHGWE